MSSKTFKCGIGEKSRFRGVTVQTLKWLLSDKDGVKRTKMDKKQHKLARKCGDNLKNRQKRSKNEVKRDKKQR